MTNPRDYLADLITDVDLANVLDDEIVQIDPVESKHGEDAPNESGPIVYYPEDDPNYDPSDSTNQPIPNESGPIVYYPENDPNYDPPDAPNESGPIYYDPENPDYGPNSDYHSGGGGGHHPHHHAHHRPHHGHDNDSHHHHRDAPADPPLGGDEVIDGCWGSGSAREANPAEGEVSIMPVDEAPAESVDITPEPELAPEPEPEMSIMPVEEAPAIVEADYVAMA
jgi:hypothetical protein